MIARTAVVTVLLLSALAGAAQGAVRSPCTPGGREPVLGKGERQRLLAVSSEVQVFQVVDPADISGARATFACLRGSKRRPVGVGSARPGGPTPRPKFDFGLQVAGRFVGYSLAGAGVNRLFAGPAIRVMDVRRRSHRTFIGATDFALRRDGTFDAIVRVGPFAPRNDAERQGLAPGAGPFEVRRYGRVRDRSSVRLDSGEGIDPTSMAGRASRTYWLKGGVPATAPSTPPVRRLARAAGRTSPRAGAAVVRSPCAPDGRRPVIVGNERQRPIFATPAVRVFEVIDPADIAGGRVSYACLAGSRGRPVSVGSARPGGPSTRIKRDYGLQAAGRFAGFQVAGDTYSDGGPAGPAVRIVDVRRGTQRKHRGAVDFLLRRNGSLDAIVRAGPFPASSEAEAEGLAPGRGPFEVRRYAPGSRDSVRLDAGEGIDPLSLAGDERRTYWLKAGVPMSARR